MFRLDGAMSRVDMPHEREAMVSYNRGGNWVQGGGGRVQTSLLRVVYDKKCDVLFSMWTELEFGFSEHE